MSKNTSPEEGRSSISEPFIHRPVMTVLLTLSVIVFGVFSYRNLPVSDLPSVDYPVITVSVSFPGMEPATMAANVATPLEKEFMKIQGLQLVTSSSSQGFSRITLQFDLNKDIDAAATDVQAAISRAGGTLPPDLPAPPVYEKTDPNSHPVYYLGLTTNSMTLGQLYDFATVQVGQKINILPGVSQVQIYGVPRAVRIEVDPQKLYNRGISMNDVAMAIKAGTVSTSSGRLEGKSTLFALIPEGQIEKAADYKHLIIAYKNGTPVYLKDVADCIEGLAVTNLAMNFWAKRAPKFEAGIILAVIKAAGANTIEVSSAINNLIPKLRSTLPGSVALTPIYDRAASIVDSLQDVQETLYIAFVLVVLVVFLFLGKIKDTIIPSVAIPISLLITFICMEIFGFSIDNLSLMALTLSIGFLVDDAIVFLENMVRRMEEGEPPLTAAVNGARQISFTILSMTLSLAAVFLPLIFMGGQIGRVFREFSITIIVAILASGIVSLTLTPMLCARILGARGQSTKNRMEQLFDAWEAKVIAIYGKTLHWFLARKPISLVVWGVCLLGTFFFLSFLPKTFLPLGDSGVIMGVFISHESSSPAKMQAYQKEIDAVVQSSPHLEASLTLTGAEQFLQSSQGFIILFLKDRSKRPPIEAVSQEISGRLFGVPGILPLIRPMPALEISTGATANMQGQYAYTLSGTDEEQLYGAALALQGRLMSLPGFASVSSDLFMRNPQLRISINRDRASMLGISALQIEELLKNAYSQNYVYLIKAPTQQYQVIVAASEKYRADPENLKLLYLRSATGEMVPLHAVASWHAQPGPQAVNHINNFPAVTIFFNLVPGYSIGNATKEVEKIAAEVVPPGIQRSFQGEASAFLETVKSLFWLMAVAVFVMYVILGILYESYVHPITVLSSLPVATVGGLATLYLFGMELSLYAFIGIFMLMGIVKKNGIIMIDFAVECQKQGLSPYEAVHRSCLARFRPIMMTTVSTFMGAVPIAAGWGADGVSRMPLGLSILGGLLVSQLLTLYVTPVIYLYLEELQTKVLDKTAFFRRQL